MYLFFNYPNIQCRQYDAKRGKNQDGTDLVAPIQKNSVSEKGNKNRAFIFFVCLKKRAPAKIQNRCYSIEFIGLIFGANLFATTPLLYMEEYFLSI